MEKEEMLLKMDENKKQIANEIKNGNWKEVRNLSRENLLYEKILEQERIRENMKTKGKIQNSHIEYILGFKTKADIEKYIEQNKEKNWQFGQPYENHVDEYTWSIVVKKPNMNYKTTW